MFQQSIPFIGWIASLSNGEVVREEPPIPGEKTSWQKLLDRLGAENLKMIGIRLQYLSTTVNALPPKACIGYYQAREQRLAFYGGQESSSNKQGVGSIVGDKVYITWVDTNGNVWQDVRPLVDEKMHSTMRDVNLVE
jgi:hypothetical protein